MIKFRNVIVGTLLLMLLSGCQYMGPVTKYKKNLASQRVIEGIKKENYFEEDRWNIDYVCFSGLPCINGGFWTMISYEQGNKVFKLQEDNIIIEQFNPTEIVEKYSIDYLFNNYLFSANTNYIGVIIWWLLESNNIDYNVDYINSKVIFEDLGSEKINGIYCKSKPTNNDVDSWLKEAVNLEQVDYKRLFESSNCTLKLYIATNFTNENKKQLNGQLATWSESNRIEINID